MPGGLRVCKTVLALQSAKRAVFALVRALLRDDRIFASSFIVAAVAVNAATIIPKTALLTGAAGSPASAAGMPNLDMLFSELLSHATQGSATDADFGPGNSVKPVKPVKAKTDPSGLPDLTALNAANPATQPVPAMAVQPSPSSVSPNANDVSALPASIGDATSKQPHHGKQPVLPERLLAGATAGADADADEAVTEQSALSQTHTSQLGKPAAQTDPGKAIANTNTKPADTGKTGADGDSKSAKPSKADVLAAVSEQSFRNGPALQAAQAKALSVDFSAQPQKAESKTAQPNLSANASAKSGAQPVAAQTATDQHVTAIAPHADGAPQNTHNAPMQNAATQTAAEAKAPVTDSSINATNAANATQQPQQQQAAAQASQAALQVGQQAHNAGAQPDIAAIAVIIAARSKDGEKHFDIRLDPPDLGRVDVRLSVDNTGKVQAHLTADKPQTLDLLQRDRTTLERSLKDTGLDLANNGLNFSLKGQDRQNGNAPAPMGGSTLAVTAVESNEADTNANTNISGLRAGRSHVDIRV